MRSEVAGRVVLFALFALTIYLLYRILLPFLPGIAWSIVLVIAFSPLYKRVVALLRGRSFAGAVIMSLVIAAFIVVPTVLISIEVARGVVSGYAWLDRLYNESGVGFGLKERLPWVQDAIDWLDQYIDVKSIDVKGILLSTVRTAGSALAGKASGLVSNAVATVTTFIVVLLTTGALFMHGPYLMQRIRSLIPLEEQERDAALQRLHDVARSVFFGSLLTALVQGLLGGVGLAIVGVPSAVALGAVMFICALLPMGTILVWAPAAVWLLVSGHPWKALFLAIWGIGPVSMIDNFIRPMFIRRGAQMHALLVFFSTVGGMLAFGLIGLFIGPLILTAFLFLLDVLEREFWTPAGNAATTPAPSGSGAPPPPA